MTNIKIHSNQPVNMFFKVEMLKNINVSLTVLLLDNGRYQFEWNLKEEKDGHARMGCSSLLLAHLYNQSSRFRATSIKHAAHWNFAQASCQFEANLGMLPPTTAPVDQQTSTTSGDKHLENK